MAVAGVLGRAYCRVHCLAVSSCFCRLRLYSWAMAGTSGSAGFGSVRRDERERMTLYRESAGDHAVFRSWERQRV